MMCHSDFIPFCIFRESNKKRSPFGSEKVRLPPSSFVFIRRIWHLTHGFAQVAGFHRAVPSTALDKIYSFTQSILYKNTRFVKAYFRQHRTFTVD